MKKQQIKTGAVAGMRKVALGLAIAERVAEVLGFALLIERDAIQFTVRVPLESQSPASAISVPGGGVPLDGIACR
jgi:hypothetical protein